MPNAKKIGEPLCVAYALERRDNRRWLLTKGGEGGIFQGIKGIRQLPIKHTPNDDTKNYLLFRLQLVVEAFGHTTYLTN